MYHVTIGPEFFAKAKNDYANWEWAIVREFLQNSIDCGSKCIDITVKGIRPGLVELQVANDGEPMTHDIVVNKLFSLGSSGKDFQGTVGGFGKAKEILYFCHESYRIKTGNLVVTGKGAAYDIAESSDYLWGTCSTILISGTYAESMEKQVRDFASFLLWKGRLTLNGEHLATDAKKGTKKRELDWCTIYLTPSTSVRTYTLSVRVNGMPMFTRYAPLNRGIVVEINGSLNCLYANRDGLCAKYRQELDEFITEITLDPHQIVKAAEPVYYRFPGTKLTTGKGKTKKVDPTQDAYAAPLALRGAEASTIPTVCAKASPPTENARWIDTDPDANFFPFEVIVKSELEITLPRQYMPNSPSYEAQRLLMIWQKCLLAIHDLFGDDREFAVGFVFSDVAEAQYGKDQFGRVFLLNPCVVTGRRLKARWGHGRPSRYALLAVAVHEYVHSMGFGPHDANYASKLTDVMGAVMTNIAKFNGCFTGIFTE